MTRLHELANFGQAIWLDYIRRSFLKNGDLQKLIDDGLRGMTSNPTIFEKAINGSQDYDATLQSLALQGKSAPEIYEELVVEDIQTAADLLLPVYQATHGEDGYVSLEVAPNLARDTAATQAEAERLWIRVARPNLMIKIPGTLQGLPAITHCIARGINVNVTLIFSIQRYQDVIEAYLAGLEQRLNAGSPIDHVASVASFFISRLDTKVDKMLAKAAQVDAAVASIQQGQSAVVNARMAYSLFKNIFSTPRFQKLQASGARYQRPLWASTSTKNPAYSDILYVQELIGVHTVNTLPQDTIDAFMDHGEVRSTIENDLDQGRALLDSLEKVGISMQQVTRELEDEGVLSFEQSFNTLMSSIETKRKAALDPIPGVRFHLGKYQQHLANAMLDLEKNRIMPRIWACDHTVWQNDPTEITNRLGWLHIAEEMQTRIGQIEALVYAVQQAGYTDALLLGMGGSSLAPELFSKIYSVPGGLRLQVLDSTHPGAVLEYARTIDPARCLYIVSTKSGTTGETLSFFKYFYNQTVSVVGKQQAGDHFIAITDPGSKLVSIAQDHAFRATLLNDPNIGGRYSALSFFGLFPAALVGTDINKIIKATIETAGRCGAAVPTLQNPAAWLGAALGVLAAEGRDKLTFFMPPSLGSFGDWVEQLIAESTGKIGKGILPVVTETPALPALYGDDRVFVEISSGATNELSGDLAALKNAGHPVLSINIDGDYDLGGQFFLWELATAVAGHILAIQPFDQPNVESAKKKAREMLDAFLASGTLPEEKPALQTSEISVYGDTRGDSPESILTAFLDAANPGDYVALQAFIQPGPLVNAALAACAEKIRARTRLATTVGLGPRFLHSTGQLHKGDRGNGLFIQFTSDIKHDTPIPDQAGNPESAVTFGTLVLAQALGDGEALRLNSRRLVRFHIHGDAGEGILRLAKSL